MTKTLKITALILALCAIFAMTACGKEAAEHSGYVLASSDKVDYFMYVPETWKIDKSSLFTSAYCSSGDATSISATAYGLSFSDPTLENWWKGFAEEFKLAYTDTDIDKAKVEEANLGGVDGRKYTFKGSLAGQEYDFIMVAATKGGYVYYLTYTSVPKYYKDHLEELGKVIEYFEFK